MALEPVARQSLSESVFLQLQDKIVRGELAPESALPSERALSEALAVNRGAVREAIKRLQQAGLVAVRHGGNHTICNFEEEAGLELLPSLLVDGRGRLDIEVLRSIMAMRSALAPEVAASAAEKGGEALAAKLETLLDRMRQAERDLVQLQSLVFDFWKTLVAGSGNIAFRLAFNSMTKTYVQAWDAMRRPLEPELRDIGNLRAIAAAVRARDVQAARTAARRHIEIGRAAMDKAFGVQTLKSTMA
jgi:DNA-binding FadR family transcriptional regulator